MAYMRIRLISVVTKNLKKVDRLEAEILAHKVAKKEKKSHGRLDPTLRMREVVHSLYRGSTRLEPPTFYLNVYIFRKKETFFPR